MAKQINQYTKVRTESTVQLADLLDFDSTDDVGVTYESARITVKEFRDYLRNSIPTLYSQDGSIGSLRNVAMGGNTIEFEDGTINIKGSGSTSATTSLLVENSLGNDLFTVLDDGFVGVGASTPTLSESLRVVGGLTVSGVQANQLFVHPTLEFVGMGTATTPVSNETLRTSFHIVSGAYISTSNAIPSNAGLNMTTNDKININNVAVLGLDGTGTITQLDAPSGGIQFRDASDVVMASFNTAGNFGIGGAATNTSTLNISGLPTSSVGLVTGDIWNNSGVLTIV